MRLNMKKRAKGAGNEWKFYSKRRQGIKTWEKLPFMNVNNLLCIPREVLCIMYTNREQTQNMIKLIKKRSVRCDHAFDIH